MNMGTVALQILEELRAFGVDRVFGIPGGAVGGLYAALEKTPDIAVVHAKHETGAAFMALGYAMATGRPGVLFTTAGPGITNAITGLMSAYYEGVPVIHIAGEVSRAAFGRGALQESSSSAWDAVSIASRFTKFSAQISRSASTVALVRKALSLAHAYAANAALADASVSPQDIDLLLVASPVPDRILPGNGPAIADKCGLINAVAWNYEVGCAVFLPMLVTADALIRTGAYKKILVVASSALTRVLDYSAPMSAAFGDGAAAAVIEAGQEGFGLLGHWMRTDGALREGAVFAPVVQGQPVRAWTRANGEVRLMSFDPDAIKHAGRQAVQYCKEACAGALAAAQQQMSDVALYVGAQSQGWFVEGCRLGLGLPKDKTIDTFAEVANIGPATLLFNLHRARQSGRLRSGDTILMYSPGVGLTRAAVCYRWHNREAS